MSGHRVGGDGGATESCTLPDTPPDSDVEVDEQSPKSVPPEDSNSTPVSGLCFFGGEWFVIPGYSCPMLSIPILFLLFIVFPCQVSTSQ